MVVLLAPVLSTEPVLLITDNWFIDLCVTRLIECKILRGSLTGHSAVGLTGRSAAVVLTGRSAVSVSMF